MIKTRRSIRSFNSNEIDDEKIEKLLEAAKWAPSAGNLQARDVILVKESETKHELVDASFGQRFIEDAYMIIVVCANTAKSESGYGHRGAYLYCIQDATTSIQNILLMASALGLGSCWIGAFDEEKVREILNIPAEVRPIALIPVGYSDTEPKPPSRSLSVHNEKW